MRGWAAGTTCLGSVIGERVGDSEVLDVERHQILSHAHQTHAYQGRCRDLRRNPGAHLPQRRTGHSGPNLPPSRWHEHRQGQSADHSGVSKPCRPPGCPQRYRGTGEESRKSLHYAELPCTRSQAAGTAPRCRGSCNPTVPHERFDTVTGQAGAHCSQPANQLKKLDNILENGPRLAEATSFSRRWRERCADTVGLT